MLAISPTCLATPARADQPGQADQPNQVDQADQSSQSLKQLSIEQLGQIEVTSVTKEPAEVWNTPAAIYVLTSDQIHRSGATTIPEMLRLIPGVEVEQIDSSQWAVGIRGFGDSFSRSVLVLIDGRSVYTPLFAGVYWDVQNVLPEDIDRIEVIRGPGGTIWGSNAVNGVINIITKSAMDTHGTYATSAEGNVTQSFDAIRYGGGNGKTFGYRGYAMGFGRAPEDHPDGNNFDAWQLGQAGFRMDWSARNRNSFTLQGDLYKGSVGQLVNIGILGPNPSSVNIAGAWDVSGGDLMGHWRHDFVDGSDFQLRAYYDRTYRLGVQYGESRNTFDVDLVYHRQVDARNNIITGTEIRLSPSHFIKVWPTVNFLPYNQAENLYSFFLQDQISLVPDKLSLTIGSKFEHNIYTGWEFEPSARLLWTPTPHQTFWAAITRAVRTPSRIDTDLQLSGVSPGATPIYVTIDGNPDFASEALLGYEAGYRKLITHNLYLDVSAFWNRYNKLSSYGNESFALVPSPPAPPPTHYQFTLEYGNGIQGTSKGLEIAPDWQATRWLRLEPSYSYVILNLNDRRGFTDTGTLASYEGLTPRNEGSVQAFLNLPKTFHFDADYRYVGALPAASVNAYNTMDARASRNITPNIELSAVGQDLFQSDHREFTGSPDGLVEIKRSFYGQITWRQQPSKASSAH